MPYSDTEYLIYSNTAYSQKCNETHTKKVILICICRIRPLQGVASDMVVLEMLLNNR